MPTDPNTPDPNAAPAGTPPPVPPAAPPAAAPAPATWMEGEGWTPELKADKTLGKYKSPADLAVAHVNLSKMLGNRVEVPTDQTPPEQAQVFWSKLGVPESPEGYEAPKLPEGYTLDTGMVDGFRKVALDAKITKSGADKLMSWYVEQELIRQTSLQAEFAQEKEEGMKALRNEWGAAADQNIGLCQRVVAQFGGADFQAALNETGAGNDPRVVKFLAKIGRVMAEDGLVEVATVGTKPNEAQAKITAIMNDKKHAYWDADSPGHKQAVVEMSQLYELVHNQA